MTSWIIRTAATDADPLTFRLSDGAVKTVGRATGADFILDRPLVSRLHCRMTARANGIDVEDLHSTNGTFVNGQRITRAELKTGDRLTLGRAELIVELQ